MLESRQCDSVQFIPLYLVDTHVLLMSGVHLEQEKSSSGINTIIKDV